VPPPAPALAPTPAPGLAATAAALPPIMLSYNGFPYEIPHPLTCGPYFCVTKGRRVGVLATWYVLDCFFPSCAYGLAGRTPLHRSLEYGERFRVVAKLWRLGRPALRLLLSVLSVSICHERPGDAPSISCTNRIRLHYHVNCVDFLDLPCY
jgi:hypothetical protein